MSWLMDDVYGGGDRGCNSDDSVTRFHGSA
jgi:hypothetical protein